MKKTALHILILAAALTVLCIISRFVFRNDYIVCLPAGVTGDLRFDMEKENIVSLGDMRTVGRYTMLPVAPENRGDVFVDLIDKDTGDPVHSLHLRVGPFHTVYDLSTGGFTGDAVTLFAVSVFCLGVAVIMYRQYKSMTGPAFYAYATIFAVGIAAFMLLTGLTLLVAAVRHATRPYEYPMFSAYSAISDAPMQFMMLTTPLVLVFSVAMAVSNAALLRHERFRGRNVLGIGVGLMLVAGEVLGFWFGSRDLSGSYQELLAYKTVQNVYASIFVYFECMLLGSIVCGLRAAKHVPPRDRDYILILGCRFRKDGTLTPLLQGRVDRAIAFREQQLKETGKEAILIPSGGQGPDEVMAEAEAMRRYLLSKGVPESAVLPENRSKNTFENMTFSKDIIEGRDPSAKVAYVTTNYHVFRSGVWAQLANLPAEGLGSKTKWWYWPNAFMRECVGLMANRLKIEAFLLVVTALLFAGLTVALGF